MVGINTALSLCGVRKAAFYFFESSAKAPSDLLGLLDVPFTTWPLAFAAEEEDFGHSLAVCPTPPQKRQRLFANRQARSSVVSLLSLPSLLPRSNVLLLELLVEELDSRGTNGFFDLSWVFWFDEEDGDCWCVFSVFFSIDCPPHSRQVSSSCSQ